MAEYNPNATPEERARREMEMERRQMLERGGRIDETPAVGYTIPLVVLGAAVVIGILLYATADRTSTPGTQVGQNVERQAPSTPQPKTTPQQ